MTNVVYLHGQPKSIAQFVRVGASGHRHLEQLLAAGRLPVRRFVIDAGALKKQRDLISALQEKKRELVLDTNVAELSSVGRFRGFVKEAPWAGSESVLTPAHFKAGTNRHDIVGKIARCAVQYGVQRVHAPAHFLNGVKDGWATVDLESCNALRKALDIEGGRNISIDYPLMITNAIFNDTAERRAFVKSLRSCAIDSLWLRISGFGAGATATGVRKYIAAARDFHTLEMPIIADGIGGMAALALLSFEATCGIAHGVAEKERFDASDWNKPARSTGGGGGYSLLLPGIDRLLTKMDAEALVAAPGGRRLLSCNDRTCCPHGFEDTLKDPRGHYLRQRVSQIEALSAVPEQRRVRHFLDTELTTSDRIARQAAKLKLADSKLSEALAKNAVRLDRMRAVLEDLYRTESAASPPRDLSTMKDHQENNNPDRR